MNSLFSRNQFFVREHVGILQAANSYDIHDLQSQQPLLECREPNLGFFTKLFRVTKYKTQLPFDSEVRYAINIEPTAAATDEVRRLVLAAALSIDLCVR